MIRTLIYALMAVEATLCFTLWLRRRREWPVLGWAMLVVALAYACLGWIRWFDGVFAYRDAVNASRWIFTITTSAVCIQAVVVMAAGINGYRLFAVASSVVFAAVAGAAVVLMTPAIHAWAVGCGIYLVANQWLYMRSGQLPSDARKFGYTALLMVLGNAAALLMLQCGKTIPTVVIAAALLQRAAPIAALLWWLNAPKAPAVTPEPSA